MIREAAPGETDLAESYRATAIAAGALSTGPFVEEALRHLGRLSSSARCSILLVEDGRLRPGATSGLPAQYTQAIDGLVVSPTGGACSAAAAMGRPRFVQDVRADSNWTGFRSVAEAEGVRSCWAVPVSLPDGCVLGVFASYSDQLGEPGDDALTAVQEYAPIVALGLESIRRQSELARNYESIVLALTSALDSRDEYTAAHSSETAALAERVGARLGLSQAEQEQLARVAVLHDIGKLGIPTEILGKAGPLTTLEWEIMRRHPVIGERILARVPFLEPVAKAVRHEHERWDGGGYPDGLSGERIPMSSRIVFVCDSFHAMTSDRPYRAAMAEGQASAELREHAGSQFDPAVVTALLAEIGAPSPERLYAGHVVRAQARGHALGAIAEQLEATDLFVLRPLSGARWCHLDGVGRGTGWAGNLELETASEPHVRRALETDAPVVIDATAPVRVVGPYYARSAAVVLARSGDLVIFGSGSGRLADVALERLGLLAERAAHAVSDVPPAKRLEDELEVLDAVRAVTTVAAEALPAALSAVAGCAAGALSCEFAAIMTVPPAGGEPVIGWAGPGWSPATEQVVRDAMAGLMAQGVDLPLLVQDTSAADAPLRLEGFGADDGITSLQALPVGSGPVAVLLVAHATSTPRGFTLLCRRVAGAMADAAEVVVRRAVAQERLAAENEELAMRVATDALTGVASRAWWEGRLARHFESGDPEVRHWSVVAVDVDGLKAVNDSHGHRTGDELLRACGRLLQDNCRAGDRVARIGGDEFAVLLCDAGPKAAAAWCERLAGAAAEHRRRIPGLPLAFSAGWGSTASGEGLYAALARADERMYEAKRARRARVGTVPATWS